MTGKDFQELLGKEIRAIRESKGISRYRMFTDINIQIGRIEDGEVGVCPETYLRICKYLDIPLDLVYRNIEDLLNK